MSADDDPTELGITEADRRQFGRLHEARRDWAQTAHEHHTSSIPEPDDPAVEALRSRLADWPDEYGTAHLSAQDVARRTEHTVRQAGRLLAALERAGDLSIESASGKRNTYAIQL